MSTRPTDAELKAMWQLHAADIGGIFYYARAVLEKWGTPPPAPATQQPEGDVVAYLDVGASGYLDLGAALSEDALQQLPKGRHALVIAGTYGIDGYVAAPQPPHMAQAVAVPLTPDQIAEIADAAHREYNRLVSSGQCAPRWSAVFAHLLEMHHGIKGDQHVE
jgi:hypothetical protein